MRETRIRLDRHRLAEERVWRTKNYETQVERVKSLLRHLLEVDIPQAERRLDYDDEMLGADHGAVAANIISCIMQGVSNMDFRGLAHDASDITHVEKSIRELDELMASLPEDVAAAFAAADDAERARREDLMTTASAVEREKEANRCDASVHAPGRGSDFHRCRWKK